MKKLLLLLLLSNNIQAQDNSNIKLLFNWNDTTLPKNIYNASFQEVWGVAINDREYAIIGSTAGTHIFDVTNPKSSSLVHFIPGLVQGSLVRHRDYHDYKCYLYIVGEEGANKLRIADLSFLPDSAPVVYDSDTLFSRSHNIFIDSARAKLYTCGGDNNPGVRVFTLADPLDPTEISSISLPENSHDIFVRHDTAFCNDGNAGLFVIDFTNSANPQIIGSLTTYPDQGYNHSGWINEQSNIYAFADETHGMDVKVCEVSDLSNITVLSQINSGVDSNSIAHNLIIKEDFLYISYFHDGLYIYNISNPSDPILTGYYDTYPPPDHDSWRGAWGVYPLLPSGIVLVSDKHYGLFVFDVTDAISSIDEQQMLDNSLNIYPNPFDGSIDISYNLSRNEDVTIELFNILGNKIYSITKKSKNKGPHHDRLIIKDQKLPKGIYLIKFMANKKVITKKMMKFD